MQIGWGRALASPAQLGRFYLTQDGVAAARLIWISARCAPRRKVEQAHAIACGSLSMNVSSLRERKIVSVGANASVREAAEAMRHGHVGALVVTDPDDTGLAIGLVTDRDLVVELLAQGRSPEGLTIGALCSTGLVSVPDTATVQEAVRTMQREGVRRLLVVQPGGALIGMLSADDLFEAIAGELDGLAKALRTGISREGLRTEPGGPGEEPAPALYLTRNEP
jgi:CBS domain-containing protein